MRDESVERDHRPGIDQRLQARESARRGDGGHGGKSAEARDGARAGGAHYSVERWFAETASRRPSEVALREGADGATFAQLDAAATRFARVLRAAGAGPGTPVGIIAGRAMTYVPAFLGCLRAGAAFAPLDAGLPDLRLRRQLGLLRPPVVVAEPGLAGRAAALLGKECAGEDGGDEAGRGGARLGTDEGWPGEGSAVGLVCADGLEVRSWPDGAEAGAGAFAVEPGEAAASSPAFGDPDPDSPAYVYFTSGSTGEPKGVAGRLRAVAHFIRWEVDALRLGAGVRVSHLLPPSFDGSLRDLFVPLCAGGVICAPPSRELVADAERLAAWIAEERVELIHCVPTLLRALMSAGLDAHRPGSLRCVVVAGEALLGEDVRRWRGGREGGARLVNLYGTTETTMAKFCHFVTGEDETRRTVPIGRPIPGARALLLDEEGRPSAPGTVGEVYIRTPYRSLGYYGRPDLTARAFVPNPFSQDPSDLIYRTGDLARQLPGGEYEFVGRRDAQVKVRGQRVELGEVEAALRTHATVRQCAVAVRGEGEGAQLVAYVVGEGGKTFTELREHVRERLPAYMVPSRFVALEALPLTPSGKVDRKALPDPGAAREARVYEPPVGAVEELMAGVWAEMLGLERVGRGEDFFELGGHSLLATQIMSRARKAFSVELPLRQLFETPTVAGLAAAAERALQAGGAAEAAPISRAPRDEPLPLSFVQQRLWFIDQLEPGSAVYNIPAAVRLDGALEAGALERALSEVVRRHESLRTTFAAAEGQPVQVISPPRPLRLEVRDLSRLSAGEREAEAHRLAAEEARRPFDLARGPLFRASLVRLSDDEHVLLVTMHHIVSDGWSLGVLIREVSTLYSAYARGEESPLEELPIQYADYAAWQRARLSGEALDAQLAYWRGQLAGAPPLLELPTDRPRQALQTYRGTHYSFRLPRAMSESLKALGRKENATLFMTLLAAFDVLLDWYTGQQDIVVGTGVANRTRVETEGLIGFFVNTVVLRADLS
ncbi:MAG TPA: condensation domain-containing protein, partial [Pyrinomonadaceae bacterium]|nr:condensation domain-containing protein [Pyrinomonadaceae bacterium]